MINGIQLAHSLRMDTVALLFKHIHKIMADGNVEMLDEEGRIPGKYKNIAVDEWLVVDCRAHPSAPKKFDQNRCSLVFSTDYRSCQCYMGVYETSTELQLRE